MNASQNSCFSQRRSHIKWMFDISPVCQANLAPWHAITGPITAVCGLEGTQAILAALTGPDRLIRSVGTQNSNSQTPYISLLAHNSLQVQEALYSCSLVFFLTPFFSTPHSHQLPLFRFLASFGFFVLNQMLPVAHYLCLTPRWVQPFIIICCVILCTRTAVLN